MGSVTKFGVILADPPWRFSDRLAMSDVKRGADAQYQSTMSDAEIIGLQDLIRPILAEDAILVLWVPDSILKTGMEVMDSWGFQQKQILDWVKTADSERRLDPEETPEDLKMRFGMGRVFRNCSEHALVGTRGKISNILESRSERNVILAPNLAHSGKPDAAQNALDRMFPGVAKIELFARRRRPRWHSLGNECPGQHGVDIRTLLEILQPNQETA